MELSTPVELPETERRTELGTPVLALGSCFAERVGTTLKESFFPTEINPTGIHYNPVSLAVSLSPSHSRPEFFLHQGLWRSLCHHSEMAGAERASAEEHFLELEARRLKALERAEVLLLTLGTAQVWETVGSGRVVANCHRLPAGLFRRRRLSVDECVDALRSPLLDWLNGNAERQVILTVSPVRYLRDGLVENSRGKAVLLLAADALQREHRRIVYFPAYELFYDELRDYRFYDQDLVQPNRTGVEIVWHRFRETFLSRSALSQLPLIEKIKKLAAHRLSERSKPVELGRKGLELLETLERNCSGLDTSNLKQKFTHWASPIR